MDPNIVQNAPQQNFVSPTQQSPRRHGLPVLLKILLVLVGIVALLGLLTGAYILGEKQGVNFSIDKGNIVPPSTPPTPTPDLTADWQTYTAPTIPMGVKYPQGWTLTERKSLGQVYGVTLSGVQGSVDIAWNSTGGGFGGGCADGMQRTVNFGGDNVSACERQQGQEENWSLLYKKVGTISFSANAIVNACPGSACGQNSPALAQQTLATNQKIIFSILSHISFPSSDQSSTLWSVYNGSGFSFKYPSAWIVPSNTPQGTTYIYFVDPKSASATGNGNGIVYGHFIYLHVSQTTQTTAEYINNLKSQQISALASDFYTKMILLNGKQVEAYHEGGEGRVGWYIPFSNGNEIVDFGPLPTDPSQNSVELQIVSSFKFIQ